MYVLYVVGSTHTIYICSDNSSGDGGSGGADGGIASLIAVS